MAYSGGLDSSFLLACAHQVLGERVIAVTSLSSTYPERDKIQAIEFTKKRGIRHEFINSNELSISEFVKNTRLRCYYCKKELCIKLNELAYKMNISHIAHGANMDDLKDFRPGMKAAEESGLISPLIEANLYKNEIKLLAKEMGIPMWNKPPSACLASRIPYGEKITAEKLRVIESAEDFLISSGFLQCRVRHHGLIARIELEENQMAMLINDRNLREKTLNYLRELGFRYVCLDLSGYEMGSLNRELDMEESFDEKDKD